MGACLTREPRRHITHQPLFAWLHQTVQRYPFLPHPHFLVRDRRQLTRLGTSSVSPPSTPAGPLEMAERPRLHRILEHAAVPGPRRSDRAPQPDHSLGVTAVRRNRSTHRSSPPTEDHQQATRQERQEGHRQQRSDAASSRRCDLLGRHDFLLLDPRDDGVSGISTVCVVESLRPRNVATFTSVWPSTTSASTTSAWYEERQARRRAPASPAR